MIAVDTNVLVRYFAQDHPTQSRAAGRFLEKTLSPDQPGFISVAVLLELNWVLQSAYGSSSVQIREIVDGLLQLPTLVVEHSAAVRAALALTDQQFSDALIHQVGAEAACSHTVTFDRRFAQVSGVALLED